MQPNSKKWKSHFFDSLQWPGQIAPAISYRLDNNPLCLAKIHEKR